MTLRDDSRGVSTVVGAVLVFGILIILLSLYQAQAVPAQNANAEFEHAQSVQTDMLHLRDGLLQTAASGNTYPASVTLGARYPQRIFFVNPPPVTGRLSTAAGGQIVVSNASALDAETRDYWDGSDRTFDSKSLAYRAEYNYLDNSPRVVYENTLLYRNYTGKTDSPVVVDAGPSVVDGDEITLIALDGTVSKSGVSAASIDPKPVSAPLTVISVQNESSNVTVTLPSRVPRDTWNETLADEYDADANDGDDQHLLAVEAPGPNRIRLVLEPGTYTLRMAKLGVGTGVERPGAHYLTGLSGDNATVREGRTTRVVAQVRDAFNNPVSGQRINATTDGTYSNDSVDPSARSGENGHVAFTYTAPTQVTQPQWVNVTAWYGASSASSAPARQKVTFRLYTETYAGQKLASYKSGSATTFGSDNSGVAFAIENTGPAKIEITGIKVTTQASADNLHEENSTNSHTRTSHEVYIDASNQGWYEAGDGSNDKYTLGNAVSLSNSAVLNPHTSATINLYSFHQQGQGRGQGSNTVVDMSGKQVTVTLYFANGNSEEYTFTTP